MRYSLKVLSLTNTLRDSGFVVHPWRHLGEPLSSWPGDHVARVKSRTQRALYSAVSSYQTEQGRLETKKEGEWRLYGELKTRETLMVGETEVVLYEIHPELFEVI